MKKSAKEVQALASRGGYWVYAKSSWGAPAGTVGWASSKKEAAEMAVAHTGPAGWEWNQWQTVTEEMFAAMAA